MHASEVELLRVCVRVRVYEAAAVHWQRCVTRMRGMSKAVEAENTVLMKYMM